VLTNQIGFVEPAAVSKYFFVQYKADFQRCGENGVQGSMFLGEGYG